MIILFWSCLAAVIYVYFGYPLLLVLGALGRRQSFGRGSAQPLISIIVPAHNEESAIESKIENLLAGDYPRERLEILIGSDGSSDRTEEIVRRYVRESVGLLSFPQQQGKSAIQNGLVAASSGEILVFTDADCLLPPGALACLVESFADPSVGLVTGRPVYRNRSETNVTTNESLYLRYETWLRRQESERGIMAMASGSLFAVRRDLWRPLDQALGDDFVLPLLVARAGMKNWLEPRVAVVTGLSQNRPASMLRMKTRIISKDFRALLTHADLLDPFRHRAVAVALWSHKLLRWLVPYFLLVLFVGNICLLGRPLFMVLLGLQTAFYLLALAGFAVRGRAGRGLWSVPMSFCLVNFAALLGTLQCFAGRTSGQWKPEREDSATLRRIQAAAPSRGLK